MSNRTVCADYPRFLYIELTDKCNLACSMCRSAEHQGDVLPIDKFEEIAETLFSSAHWVDLRGWGESTILPNFFDYIDIAEKYPVRLKLITNGTIHWPRLWDRLAEANFLVGFSVDSSESQNYARLRGGASLKVVQKTLAQAVRSYQQAGLDPAESLYFCITVSLHNVHEIPEICAMGGRYGIRRFKLEPLFAAPQDPGLLENDVCAVNEMMVRLDQLVRDEGLQIEYSAALTKQSIQTVATQKVCIHPWDYCYISAQGKIGFCDHLNGQDEYTWSPWGSMPFMTWWNSEQMQQLRNEHLQRLQGRSITSCPPCNWCYERRYADLEHLIESDWQQYRVFAG